jgi:ferrous iron transport protein B
MCISTLATIKRETNSWKQMGFATFYLFAAAYIASLITYQVTVALGGG